MRSINMSAENKKKNNIPALAKKIFETFWEDEFIFDPIKSRTLSYRDFFSAVMAAKAELAKYGLKKNDRVCLLMENSLELAILYFAVLLSGFCAVPIDPRRGVEEIRATLSQAGPKFILSENNRFKSHKNVRLFTRSFYGGPEASKSGLAVFDGIDPDRIFLITFTSGSTGIPKGVRHTFGNLARSALAFRERFDFGPQNTFFHNLPMTYMAGILNLVFLPFLSGSKLVIGQRFGIDNLHNFWETPIKYSVNTFWFIPTILALLLKTDRGREAANYFKSRKAIGCVGTAPLSLSVKKDFERRYGIQLYESYGLSETLFVSTNYPRSEKDNTVGRLLEGVDLKFGFDSEISIKTPWNFYGYTGAKNKHGRGYFDSGDIGLTDSEGFLKITGRKKDIIIKGGINISPKTIQDVVDDFGCFYESTVIGLKDEIMGERIVCFFVPGKNLKNGQTLKVNKEIVKKLGSSYRIDEFIKLQQLPKNINGKIDKLKIKKEYYDSKN